MAVTPTIFSSQGVVLGFADLATDAQVSQAFVLALVNRPTDFIEASQSLVLAHVDRVGPVRVSQAHVFAYVLGRPTFRRARAWAFTMDNHDFYVLRIGEVETLIFDLTTGQWAIWKTENRTTWRAHLGTNWLGLSRFNYFGGAETQVVAGDDTYGVLWTLAPNIGVDDPPLSTQEPQEFERVVTAGIPMFMRNSPRQNTLFLTVQTGDPLPAGADITLFLSDDQGNTFYDAGTVTLEAGNFGQEVMWRSLGLIRQPGRIMEFRDKGAATAYYALNTRVSAGGAYNTDGEE
jgi:hypothetical protein